MLDAFIIERIRREREQREQHDQGRLRLPLERPLPPDETLEHRPDPAPAERGRDERDAGVVIVDFTI